MKKLITSIIIFAIGILSFSGCEYNTKSTVHFADGYYFDTYVYVKLYGCGSDELAKAAVELCGYYEKIFSRTLEDSLLYELNQNKSMEIATEEQRILADIISLGIEYGDKTGGGLDIAIEPLSSLWDFTDASSTVPDRALIEKALNAPDYTAIEITENSINLNGASLDLGAVAKGYAADRISEYLREHNVDSAIVDLGGNILCIGDKPSGEDFVIGVKKPFSNETILGLSIDGMSVVTSGTYERYFEQDGVMYHHILNPDTGMPCDNELLSVTIISESGAVCDCLSTGCFVMGMDKAMELIDSMDGVFAIFVDTDYKIYYSEGAKTLVK